MAECHGVAVLRGDLRANDLVDFHTTVKVENLNHAVGIMELEEHSVVACSALSRLTSRGAFTFFKERIALCT